MDSDKICNILYNSQAYFKVKLLLGLSLVGFDIANIGSMGVVEKTVGNRILNFPPAPHPGDFENETNQGVCEPLLQFQLPLFCI